MSPSIAILLSRIRLPALAAGVGLMIADRFVDVLPGFLPWLAVLVVFYVLVRAGTLRRDPVQVRPPVTGRWLVYNSPGTRVPSHGVQTYGQTYAFDLVYDPDDRQRPGFAWWPLARRPEDFPGFGQPVLATAGGVVVRVHDRERDHWSRTSAPGLLYLCTVELLRELFGPSRVVGNHVILDVGNGVYAVFAHLRRGSIKVAVGDRVTTGEQIAQCGNSGNTTEPHLHFQLMDHPNLAIAAGVPFQLVSEGRLTELPRNGEHVVVSNENRLGRTHRL